MRSVTNKRKRHDFYETSEWAVEQLCEVEQLARVIWEPCAGGGRLAQVLRRHGSLVIESARVRRAQHQQRLDFLNAKRLLATAVVTNPPYRLATEFIRHALCLGVEYLALLLKADFLTAQERHELVNEIGYLGSHLGADEPAGFPSSGGTTHELLVVRLGWSRLFGDAQAAAAAKQTQIGSRLSRTSPGSRTLPGVIVCR
jgi:hypothetical protein